MSLLHWPANERPREKLLEKGAMALSDAELLAIFLRTGLPGKTAVDLARELLSAFGNLRGLFQADEPHFCQVRGLGKAKYAQLQAALEIGRRHLEQTLQRSAVITSSIDTKNYLSACLRSYTHEVFACLFLDSHHRIICFEELFHGTLAQAHVHPREVVKRALSHNAAAVILAHNHPSGVAEPSEEDRSMTHYLANALGFVDVRVLDHVIVGDEVTSFAERGLL